MSFVYENFAVIAIALVASALAWIFGGTRSDLLLPTVPWFVLIVLEALFFFPQKHRSESTYEARERVWRALKRDPVVWTSLGLLALLAIPFANNGLCLTCDAAEILQGVDPAPPVRFLPFCVNRMQHLNVFLWFVSALSCLVAARHALVSRGKRMLLEMIVWNGFALAIFGLVEYAAEAPGPFWAELGAGRRASDFFSTFGYPNMAGDYFVTLFAVGAGLWRHHYDAAHDEEKADKTGITAQKRGRFWRKHYMLIPTGFALIAALYTLSRAAIILACSLAAVIYVHTLLSFLRRMPAARRFRSAVLSVGAVAVLVLVATWFMPTDMRREVDTLGTTEVLDRVTGRGQYHVRVATELWKDHVLFGCGGWGYKHFCLQKMTDEEKKQIQMVGGINVHNDYLQFLAEHGVVGFGLMAALVVLLLLPVSRAWRMLATTARFAKPHDRPARPVELFALPAGAFFTLLAAVATLVHAFGDCPLRSPAVLTLFYVELAALTGFLPDSLASIPEEEKEK